MQDVIFTLLGIGILGMALLLLRRQLQVRQHLRGKTSQIAPLEARFGAGQYRRRIQCSAMLAILALGMIAEPWITGNVARVAFGAAMLLVLGWMILLAMLDILATTTHYRRLSNRYQNEQILLEAKAKQLFHNEEDTN